MLNRRAFLGALAATSAAAVAPTSFAAPDKIRCGILGIDHAHGLDVLKVLQASPDYELVGVSEPDNAVQKKFAAMAELKGVQWLSQDALLRDNTVKMVAVESNVARLLSLARSAVDAGKHVHMDKPAGASLDEFKALLDASEKQKLLFQMGYMFRYNPGFDLVRKAVKEGWLGDIYSINGSMCTDLDAVKRARIGTFPGGMMLELASHLVDMTVLLLGAPARVTPFIRHDAPVKDALADNTLAVLEYPHALVTLESSAMEFEAFPTRRFKVVGTNGSIVLGPLEPPAARLCLRTAAGGYEKGEQTVPLKDEGRHTLDFADLAACIRGEREFAYTKQHDLLVQKTLLQASGMPA